MSKKKKLDWCICRLGKDGNWWLEETSDNIHWDLDGTGFIDPKQMNFINDLMEPLKDYGLESEIIDSAFYTFRIEQALDGNRVKVKRSKQSLTESTEPLFVLPDAIDEDNSPYADFIDHILKLRVAMINDQLELSQPLELVETEEDIREIQGNDFFIGKGSHYFSEISAILEYLPGGFELDDQEKDDKPEREEENFDDVLSDINDGDEEEMIEKDETMKWEEDEDEERLD